MPKRVRCVWWFRNADGSLPIDPIPSMSNGRRFSPTDAHREHIRYVEVASTEATKYVHHRGSKTVSPAPGGGLVGRSHEPAFCCVYEYICTYISQARSFCFSCKQNLQSVMCAFVVVGLQSNLSESIFCFRLNPIQYVPTYIRDFTFVH